MTQCFPRLLSLLGLLLFGFVWQIVKFTNPYWVLIPDTFSLGNITGIPRVVMPTDSDTYESQDQLSEQSIKTRVTHVEAVCTRMPELSRDCDKKYRFMLADEKYHVIYSEIPKVASTNWVIFMATLDGRVTVDMDSYDQKLAVVTNRPSLARIGLRYLSDLSYSVKDSYIKNYSKFVFVRHPYTRLVSAWIDKLNPGVDWYHRQYGRNILRLLRKNATTSVIKSGSGVTFPEFVRYLIYLSKYQGVGFDEHWVPYYKLACPCTVQYDVIGKIETLSEDAAYVMTHSFRLPHNASFPSGSQSHVTGSTRHVVRSYMKQLTGDEQDALYTIYEWDFLLFNYTREGFVY